MRSAWGGGSSWKPKQNYLEFEVGQGYAAGPCLREAGLQGADAARMKPACSTTHQGCHGIVLPQRPLKGHENCMGAVVSEYFVLTAAHCFTVDDEKHSIKVNVGKDAVNSDLQAILSSVRPFP